jgi:hypothetical protein
MFDKKSYMKEYRKTKKYKKAQKEWGKKYRRTKKYRDYLQTEKSKTLRSKIAKKINHKLKQEVISHYGGKCKCCGEDHWEFLTIDHVGGGGAEHRRKIGGGNKIYYWLRKNNYPKGFRVLCVGCNFSLGMYGYCPHQKELENG